MRASTSRPLRAPRTLGALRSAGTSRRSGVACLALSLACGCTSVRADASDAAATAVPPSDSAATRRAAISTSLATAHDRYLDRGDVTIRYRVVGSPDASPLLLLHGYTDRLEMWNGIADSLARVYRVIVPDVRGFGRSEVADTLATFGMKMVDDQFALLDALGLRQVHVVGHSMGGTLAANMALREPARVASATLVAGAFFEDSAETAHTLSPYVDSLRGDAGLLPFFRYILPTWPDSVLTQAADQYMADNDRHTLVRSLEGFPELALDWAAVRRSKVPAVVVVGTQDAIRPLSERIAARWPGVRYLEADGADHIDITAMPQTLEAVRLAVALGKRKGAP